MTKKSKHTKKTKDVSEKFPHKQKVNVTSLLILLFILSSGCVLRLYKLDSESLFGDEILQVIYSHYRLRPDHAVSDVIMNASLQNQAPLDYIFLHYFTKYFGDSDFLVRIPAAIYGTLTILVIYELARLLFGVKEGLISAFLLSISLFHIQFSQETRPYALITLLVPIVIYFFYRAIKEDKLIYWILLVITTFLALYAHTFTLLIVSTEVLLVVFIFLLNKFYKNETLSIVSSKKMWKVIFYAVFVTLVYIPQLRLLFNPYGLYYLKSHNLPIFTRLLSAIKQIPLDSFWQIYVIFGSALPFVYCDFPAISKLAGINWQTFRLLPYVYLLFSIFGLAVLFKEKKYFCFLWFFFFLIVLPFIELSMLKFEGIEKFQIRYIIFTLPIYLIAVSKGITFVSDSLSRRLKPIFAFKKEFTFVFTLLIMIFFGCLHFPLLREYYTSLQKEDWRSITNFIVNEIPFEDQVIFQPNWLTQNYYFYVSRMFGRVKNISPQNPKKTWWVLDYEYKKPEVSNTNLEPVLVKTFPGYISIWREKNE